MAVNNLTILKNAWLRGTNDFQQRVPEPTQSNISQVMGSLFDPMNGMLYNQFLDILVNRIGWQYVRQSSFHNPLAVFKGQKLTYGNTVQEILPNWVKAHTYEDDALDLLKVHRPEAVVTNYSQNRRDKYAISITHDELRTAFTEEQGLNNLVAAIMNVPMNSDEYDEMNIMLQLIAEYEHKIGFYKHHLSAVPTDDATGKELLTSLQTYGGKLRFPSMVYNNVKIPVFAEPEELVLLVTPETQASLNVNTLAALFNVDLAKVSYRTVVIPEFPIPNAVALLTTRDFFICNDTMYQTTSFWNPETLTTSYFLHHWGIYACSPCVPAILFTTDNATVTPVETQNVDNIQVLADPSTVKAGGKTQLHINLIGDKAIDYKLAPESATYKLVAWSPWTDSDGKARKTPIALNTRTYIDLNQVLHIQKGGLSSGDIVHVDAAATYINPSGATKNLTSSIDITIE